MTLKYSQRHNQKQRHSIVIVKGSYINQLTHISSIFIVSIISSVILIMVNCESLIVNSTNNQTEFNYNHTELYSNSVQFNTSLIDVMTNESVVMTNGSVFNEFMAND